MRADIKEKLLQLMKENPDYLYMTPDELQENSDISILVWDEFFDQSDVKRMIEKQLAKRAEIAGRKALLKLEKGKFNQGEVGALQKLIENSKLLQQRANQQERIFVTFIPPQEILKRQTEEIK